jgi:nucleotide-binding universal stress UspA family protein
MTGTLTLAIGGGSKHAAALDWVIDRARRIPSAIEVTTVLESVPLAPGFPDVERDRRDAQLTAVADAIRTAVPDASVTTVLREGDLIDELITASATANPLVVAMTRVDRVDELAHLPLGLRLLGRTAGPLVVVPIAWRRGGSGVVVGWGADAAAESVVAFAAREARRGGQPLTIVHAGGSEVPRMLDLAVQRLRAAHPDGDIRLVRSADSPAAALLDAAADASLIVVGSHGRSALEGLFVGSVSQHLLARTALPVAVVPMPQDPLGIVPDAPDEVF